MNRLFTQINSLSKGVRTITENSLIFLKKALSFHGYRKTQPLRGLCDLGGLEQVKTINFKLAQKMIFSFDFTGPLRKIFIKTQADRIGLSNQFKVPIDLMPGQKIFTKILFYNIIKRPSHNIQNQNFSITVYSNLKRLIKLFNWLLLLYNNFGF